MASCNVDGKRSAAGDRRVSPGPILRCEPRKDGASTAGGRSVERVNELGAQIKDLEIA